MSNATLVPKQVDRKQACVLMVTGDRPSGLRFIWTSGQRTRNGGFVWATGQPVQPLNWSSTGRNGVPQPDNREGNENCVGVLNNFYQDGVVWHDVACHHRKPFICEWFPETCTHHQHVFAYYGVTARFSPVEPHRSLGTAAILNGMIGFEGFLKSRQSKYTNSNRKNFLSCT